MGVDVMPANVNGNQTKTVTANVNGNRMGIMRMAGMANVNGSLISNTHDGNSGGRSSG